MFKRPTTLVALVLGITLINNTNLAWQAIADKYSPFISRNVEMVLTEQPGNAFGQSNCNAQGEVLGCTYWADGQPHLIEVANENIWNFEFEWVMLHELYHFLYAERSESAADTFAFGIMSYVQGL